MLRHALGTRGISGYEHIIRWLLSPASLGSAWPEAPLGQTIFSLGEPREATAGATGMPSNREQGPRLWVGMP